MTTLNELTDTYGCIQKDTMIFTSNKTMSLETLWTTYQTTITIDTASSNVEMTIPADLQVLVFDGKNYIYSPVKKIIRAKIYNCINKIYLDNGFTFSCFDDCQLLGENGFTNKIRKGVTIGMPRTMASLTKDHYCVIDGKTIFIKVIKKEFIIFNDYGYSLEIDNYHNFIANGIVCADFTKA